MLPELEEKAQSLMSNRFVSDLNYDLRLDDDGEGEDQSWWTATYCFY